MVIFSRAARISRLLTGIKAIKKCGNKFNISKCLKAIKTYVKFLRPAFLGEGTLHCVSFSYHFEFVRRIFHSLFEQ